jgi:hypothetical protein
VQTGVLLAPDFSLAGALPGLYGVGHADRFLGRNWKRAR